MRLISEESEQEKYRAPVRDYTRDSGAVREEGETKNERKISSEGRVRRDAMSEGHDTRRREVEGGWVGTGAAGRILCACAVVIHLS